MILGFQETFPWGGPTGFEQKILSGTKIHSIREDSHGRWKSGRKIHMSYGVRTKNYRCFREDVCESIQTIQIKNAKNGDCCVLIDDSLFYLRSRTQVGFYVITGNGMIKLAKNDGFGCITDFFKWFNKDFSGKIIHWTDFRY
jgi:hypothetical protein